MFSNEKTAHNEPSTAMRGAVVRRLVGATKHGNENLRYDLLSPAHAAAGGALGGINFKESCEQSYFFY
jgi:hypothetical protein